jgi:4-hydroxybenzoate polyprenyltransferase
MKRAAIVVFTASLAVAVVNDPAAADSAAQDVAYGAGSVLGTLVYAPFKATFCILGGITSGFTFPSPAPTPQDGLRRPAAAARGPSRRVS